MSDERLLDDLKGDPGYIRFLLVERSRIRSALLAPSMVFGAEAKTLAYSGSIGNALHNDIIELDSWLATLSPQDQELLLSWADNEEVRPAYGTAHFQGSRRARKLLKTYGDSQNG